MKRDLKTLWATARAAADLAIEARDAGDELALDLAFAAIAAAMEAGIATYDEFVEAVEAQRPAPRPTAPAWFAKGGAA